MLCSSFSNAVCHLAALARDWGRFLFHPPGFLEFWSENNYVLASSGQTHYMRGGKPGAFPSLKKEIPHPIPFELFDPFNLQKNKSDEWKAEKSRVGGHPGGFFLSEDLRLPLL